MATTDDMTPRRLLRAAQENARRLAALAALTPELAATGEPQAVLERAVDAAAELLEAHTAAAFLRRADGRGFDAVAARGLAPVEPGAPALSLERSIAGRAVAHGMVQAVEDAAPERAAGTVFARLAGDVPVGALLAAPIAEGGAEPVGVLEVYAAAPRAWPDEDRALLRTLAATCAVALRSAREAQALRESEARKGAIQEASLDGIITIDHEGTVVELNPAAEKTFGYSRGEVIGREMADLIIPPALREQHRAGLARYLATGQGPLLGRRVELSAMRADGTVFPVEIAVTRIPREGPPLFTGYIRDVTERTRAEDERAELLSREQATRAEAEAAQQRLAFLAAASAELTASLDYEATLTSLAHLAVPYFADWCGIDLLEEDGSIRQLAVAHVDPAKVEWARELRRRYPIHPDEPHGVPHVLRTGQPEIYAEIPESMLVASAADAEQLEILRRVGMKSAMLVPLVAHGRVLGVITFVAAESGRHYGPADLTLGEDFVRRAALAVDNARLFATTRDDARRLAALNRVAEVVIGAPTFGAMCDRALAVLTEVLDAHAGTIHVYDQTAPPERALRMVSWYGISDEAADAGAALPLGVGVIGQAALGRGPVVADGLDGTQGRISSAPTVAATVPVHVRLPGLEGRASAPMLVRGHLLGVLTVATPEPRAWRAADLILLQTVANQLAAALEAEQLRSAAAAAAAAREAERLKSELLSTVSHELRTPLGAIKGFASGLLHYGDRLDEADRTESLRSIDHAADRLTELIDNLLDLQRLEAGRLTVIHGIVDLAELATMVVTEMAPRAPNHTLDLMIAPDVPPVMGDARRLRQVLQNLIENAVKYSPNGGRVAVRVQPGAASPASATQWSAAEAPQGEAQRSAAVARPQGGAQAGPGVVELRVEDEGVGIPPDQLHAIFERFHRVDNSATRRIGGTGLGLAIVKGLVTAHGGTIHAESEGEGRGSTFVVTLSTPQKGATSDE